MPIIKTENGQRWEPNEKGGSPSDVGKTVKVRMSDEKVTVEAYSEEGDDYLLTTKQNEGYRWGWTSAKDCTVQK